MREILFRGKDPESGEWYYGYYVKRNDGDRGSLILEDYFLESYEIVKPETVGQYTGLSDKNGRKIFEGDILLGRFDDLFPMFSTEESRCEVVWHDFGWHIKNSYGIDPADQKWIKRHYKVIGNIYDNPELVEGERL